MARFNYSPLDVDLQEVRLVKLLAGVFDDAIELEIFHAPLSDINRPSYEALSYVWGSVDNPKTVSIHRGLRMDLKAPWYKKLLPLNLRSVDVGIHRDYKNNKSSNPQTLCVTQNLFNALQHLRLYDVHRVLWIDAICINQEDILERSAEVGRMGSIYSSASQSIIWLGPRCKNSALAIETLQQIGQDLISDIAMKSSSAQKGSRTEMLQEDHKALEAKKLEWMAIRDLLHRNWFTRLWIHQEIKLSKRAMVIAGLSQLSWDTFRWSIYWVMSYVANSTASVSDIFDDDYLLKYISPVIAPLHEGARVLSLLRNTRGTFCSDPKDRVYGILGMLPPDLKLGIVPNYCNTKEEVYRDLVQRYIVSTGLLNIFAFCELQDSSPSLPTWIPDLSVPKRTLEIADGYASQRSRAAGVFSQDGKEICFTGVYASTIQHTENPVPYTTLLSDIINLTQSWEPSNVLTRSYVGGGTTLDAYTKTLVCGEVKECLPPHAGDVPTLREVRSVLFPQLHEDTIDSAKKKIAKSILRVFRGRAFGTTSKGYMGAFPAAAQVGDQICVAICSKVPLLLRPVPCHQNHYQIVGECYVPGLMDGEALLDLLPVDWRLREVTYNTNRVFVNNKGETSLEDPRLGSLPPNWHIVYEGGKERSDDGSLQHFWFENGNTGEGSVYDPRLTKEVLLERGVDMKDFIII